MGHVKLGKKSTIKQLISMSYYCTNTGENQNILVFSSVWAITAHRDKLFYGRFLRILKSIAIFEIFQEFLKFISCSCLNVTCTLFYLNTIG